MTRRLHGAVTSIFIYPDPDGPGQEVTEAAVHETGLDGDRPKKAPLSLVTLDEYVASHPRANVVVDLSSEELDGLVGAVVQIGEVRLTLTERKASCGVVYATVAATGVLSAGAVLDVAGNAGD